MRKNRIASGYASLMERYCWITGVVLGGRIDQETQRDIAGLPLRLTRRPVFG